MIEGNEAADEQAGKAARDGRKQGYENKDYGLNDTQVHKKLLREAARLAHGVLSLFPRIIDDPTEFPCEVPSVTAVRHGKSSLLRLQRA